MKILIEKIEIQNYRSCKDCAFSPHERLSTLIGPNGSGKTSILRSVLLMKHLVHQDPLRRAGPKLDTSTVKITLRVDNKKIIHTADLFIDNDERNRDRIISSNEKWYMRDVTGNKKLIKAPVSVFGEHTRSRYLGHAHDERYFYRSFLRHFDIAGMESKDTRDIVSAVASFYDGVTYYSASQFTDPTRCPVSIEVEEEGPQRPPREFEGHRKWLLDLYGEYSNQTPEYLSYVDIVGKNGIGLLDDIKFTEMPVSNIDYTVRVGGKIRKRQRTKRLVIPQILISNSTLSPSQLSEGTFKTLGMLFYLMTGKGSVILLEEPEVCIHHGLLSSVVELIRNYSKDKQIFVSTHSDFILDAVDEESVFVVKNDIENGTEVSKLKSYLSAQDRGALKRFLRNEGSLGEYWRMGAIDG
ncbi:MAG: ATP-binding protein [Gammaproteobacteria bacterium]|nr:ATP-binding protein [Gammaproteobacteria bacterium]